jgi:hypothetical protein
MFNVEESNSVSRSWYSEVDVKIPDQSMVKKKSEVWWTGRKNLEVL